MNTQIRPARSADVERLAALSRRTIAASYGSFLGEEAVAGYIDSGAVDRYVAESVDRSVVIVADGVVAGFSVTSENLLDLMMIDVDHHRRGLGAELLRHVEAMLFERYDELVLESFRDNAPANAFYRRSGWREVETYPDSESGVDKVRFRKSRRDESGLAVPPRLC